MKVLRAFVAYKCIIRANLELDVHNKICYQIIRVCFIIFYDIYQTFILNTFYNAYFRTLNTQLFAVKKCCLKINKKKYSQKSKI